MKKTLVILLAIFVFCACLRAQDVTGDSSITLSGVTIRAFEQNRGLKEVTAAVNYISQSQLERFNNSSILPALNSTPGVRMEERSPGSYRMNIRGSTLRSPFGVRNVKIYWNDLPLTDPGGNTYLNQLAYYNFNSIEIIKGPGSSLYGSGSGGVMLINGFPEKWVTGASLSYITGSYNLQNFNARVTFGEDKNHNLVSFTHQSSDGYRDHTNMRRDVINWQTSIKATEKQELKAAILYGDLYYQTPGALTLAEYTVNARASRPKAGTLPSADSAKAAIFQKTFLAGLSNVFNWSGNWQNTTSVYGAFTNFKNPTFRAYEIRTEPHFGGRTNFKWEHATGIGILQVLFGGEAQKGFFNTSTFANMKGKPGAVQTNDDLNNWTYFLFSQVDLRLHKNWNITAGASINRSSVTITRLSVPNFTPVKRTYSNQLAPRIAVSKKLLRNTWLYASIALGFSPPTVAELLPGTVTINTSLQPEEGTSYEAGIKSSWLKEKLYTEINIFSYKLSNAIVVRKDVSNANYYVNAGSTQQRGIEAQVSYNFVRNTQGFIRGANVQLSYTLNDFHYADFKQGTTDFSGKQLPSVSPNTVAGMLDINLKPGLYTAFTYYYCDPIALNDANTFRASSYQLLGGKIGWKKTAKQYGINLFLGADNLFDVKYSLGNDINAAGDRYFNVAPGRNYYAGVAFQWTRAEKK
ncbi:MAG: TonB-dependent receptor [Chitinophagaceae bacterium]